MKSGHDLISISIFKLIQEIESISRSPKNLNDFRSSLLLGVGKIVTLFTFFEREIQNLRKHSIIAGISKSPPISTEFHCALVNN